MMRIEFLSTSPDRAGRYTVKFSDGNTLRLYRQTVEDFALYNGQEFSEKEFLALQTAASRMSAKMRAVRIIAASAVSKKDLQQRLVQKECFHSLCHGKHEQPVAEIAFGKKLRVKSGQLIFCKIVRRKC